MKIDKNTVLARNSDLMQATVGSEIVLMAVASGKCFGLSETGSDVWRLLERPTNPGSVIEVLSQEYDAPPGVIDSDVLELLEQMSEQGLIEVK